MASPDDAPKGEKFVDSPDDSPSPSKSNPPGAGGAAMQDLGIFDAGPPAAPGGLDLDGLGLSSGLSSNFSPFGASSGLSMD